jgi:hypothetical protein
LTLDDVRDATREAAVATEDLAAHMVRLRERVATHFPLTAGMVAGWDDDPKERLHAMLRMFEQLYDLVGRKLLRGYLLLSGEDATRLSAMNVARRVEALGALPSADRWIELGATRNRLVHDYPVTTALRADMGNAAWDHMDDLLEATALALRRLREERLI